MSAWTQEDIDNDMFRHDDPEDCDCQFVDIDTLEGRGHCANCGRSWYLTTEELMTELAHEAEYAQSVADEMEAENGSS